MVHSDIIRKKVVEIHDYKPLAPTAVDAGPLLSIPECLKDTQPCGLAVAHPLDPTIRLGVKVPLLGIRLSYGLMA